MLKGLADAHRFIAKAAIPVCEIWALRNQPDVLVHTMSCFSELAVNAPRS
jgi:hypothetical protein